MPTREELDDIVLPLLTQQGGSDRITGSEVREARNADMDYVDQQDDAVLVAAASDATTKANAAEAAANAYTDDAVSGLSGGSGSGTATTFNGAIKFDKIPARYATVNSSDIAADITPDATGAVLLGEYYLTVVEDGGGEPTLDAAFKVYPNTQDYDTTDGNSTLYLFQNVAGTYYVGRIQQGVAAAANQAPTATSVSISGTAQEGETLTGSYTYADNESDTEGASQFQWYRADNGSGLNRAAISGATSETYDLVTGDVGKYIQYGVTPVATSGTTPGTQGLSSYTSAVIAIGANQAPVASSVAIAGTAKVGQTLTGSYTYSDNELDAEGASVKQWYRADNGSGLNLAAISGATNSTYMLVSGDLGKFIQYSVTPVAATGTSPGSAAVSSYTSAVLENVAPTVSSRVATGPNTIVVTYSEVVTAASSTGNSFNNGGALTISGMTGTGTNTLTFTITETMTSGDTITHTYSGTVIKDAANNNLAAFTSQAVTNSISGGYDADAQAFFDQIVADGGTLTTPQKDKVDDLITGFKANGTYTKRKAFWLLNLGTAGKCKYNIKDPIDADANFRLTYTGSATFSATGYATSGSQHIDTHLSTSALTISSCGLGIVRNIDAGSAGDGDIGARGVGYTQIIAEYTDGNCYMGLFSSGAFALAPSSPSVGYLVVTRSGSLTTALKDGVVLDTDSTAAIVSETNPQNILIGAINDSTGTAVLLSSNEYSFAEVWDSAPSNAEVLADQAVIAAYLA